MIELRGFHGQTITSLAFTPDGTTLATATSASSIGIWDTADGRLRAQLVTGDSFFSKDVEYTPDSSLVVAGVHLQLWTESQNRLLYQNLHFDPRIAVSPNGALVAVVFGTNTLLMGGADVVRIETENGKSLPSWRGPMTTGGIAFSPDGRVLATGHIDERTQSQRRYNYDVLIREVDSGAIVQTVRGATQPIRCLTFSPDGSRLVTLSGPNMRIYRVGNGEMLFLRKCGKLHFQSLAFTPDGRYLLTTSNDETARVWDTERFEEITAFSWKIGRLTALAIAPDGLRAAVGGSTGSALIWDLDL